jgi:hypothetical protein
MRKNIMACVNMIYIMDHYIHNPIYSMKDVMKFDLHPIPFFLRD